MIYVVDASVGVKWFIEEDYSEKADKLLEDFSNGYVDLVAPKSFIQEFCNAIRKYVVRGYLKPELANKYIEEASEIPIEYIDTDWNIVKKAYKKALKLSITTYDAIYIVIAEKLNATIITADNKLFNQLKKHTKITHIKNYRSPQV